MTTLLEKFDIRNFIDYLTPAKGKNRYICPVCSGNNLSIDPKTGEYQCWNGCKCRDIREAVSPWNVVAPSCISRQTHPKLPSPAPIPDEPIELARLPEPVTHPEKRRQGNRVETKYPYSDTQWVVRIEKPDSSQPKGYNKITVPYHINADGEPINNKGDAIWKPYRLDEVEAHGAGKWVLGDEGEPCVEVARYLELVAFTLQGSDWTEDALTRACLAIKTASAQGIIYFPDHDNTGYEKARKLALAAAKAQVPFIQIDPILLWSECPEKGDIADWVKWGMEQGWDKEEFIQRLEQEIHRAVAVRNSCNDSLDGYETPTPIESPTKLPLREAVQIARAILQEGGSDLDINIRLEELRERCKMGSYAWDQKIIKPLRRELEAPRLKLELATILQEPDEVERLRLLAALAPKYSMSASTLEKALRAMKSRQETPAAKVFELSDFFAMESEGLRWLVPGLLPRGETVLLAGPPKGGKTLVAVDLAFAIATGEDYFLGEQLQQGKVLLVSVDESAASTKSKLIKRGFRSEDSANIRIVTSWDITQIGVLEQQLEGFRPDLVIIDSLKRITKGSPVSENSAEFADNIYSIKELLTRYGASGVLIHHTSKNPELLGVYQVRGSSAISGAVWGHLLLHPIPRKDPEQNNKLKVDPADPMRVLAVHARDSEGQELRIELNPENSSWINHGQIGEANADEQQSLKLRVLDVLAKNSHRAWTGREIIDLLGMTTEEGRGIYTTLNRLVERREINCRPSPTGRGQVYSAVDEKPLPPPPPPSTDSVLNSKVESTDITSYEPIQHQFNTNSTTNSTESQNTPLLNRPNDPSESISAVEFNNITPQGGEGVEKTALATDPILDSESAAEELSTQPVTLDSGTLISRTDAEIERLRWSTQQGKDYLKRTYGKRSRQLLTDAELLDFLRHLESLPAVEFKEGDSVHYVGNNVELAKYKRVTMTVVGVATRCAGSREYDMIRCQLPGGATNDFLRNTLQRL